MTLRLWPRSLQGQLLFAVAIALLLAQTFSAFLVYRAQAERREISIVHAAGFRLLSATRANHYRPGRFESVARFPEVPRSFRLELTAQSPIRPDEPREVEMERQLRRILVEQDFVTDRIIVVRRPVHADPVAARRLDREARILGRQTDHAPGNLLLVAAHRPDQKEWHVVRVLEPANESIIIRSLVVQTLLIYVVVVGAIALIMRRITRPLAALTRRVERFAETRDMTGRVPPEGPDDVRRLIVAQNAMESRISALLDEKDVMLGAIGHDLKTPLAALRVRIESVEDESERAKMATTIEDIVRTLDDILSLARVGRPSDPLETSELSALVASVVEDFEDIGGAVTLGETERIAAPVRATWLRRALRNLIGNALRYGFRARVSLIREDGMAIVRIDDDGPGIPDGDIERMLEPFTRGEPSRNSETGGAGLGLTLAHAIAQQHGGMLRLANRRNADGHITGLRAELRLVLT